LVKAATMATVLLSQADCLARLREHTITARSHADISRWVRAKTATVAHFSTPQKSRVVWLAVVVVAITPTKARWRCRARCEAGNGKQAGICLRRRCSPSSIYLYMRVLAPAPVRMILSSAVSSPLLFRSAMAVATTCLRLFCMQFVCLVCTLLPVMQVLSSSLAVVREILS